MRRWVLWCVVAFVLMTPANAMALAGLSDSLGTDACWINPPYALVKYRTGNQRYLTVVVRARSTTPSEDRAFLPVGYDGIVPLDELIVDVGKVAFTGRFLVAWEGSGVVAILDLADSAGEPSRFATLSAANEFLSQSGVQGVNQTDFRSFESVYWEYGLWPVLWKAVLLLCVGLLLCGALVLWARGHPSRISLLLRWLCTLIIAIPVWIGLSLICFIAFRIAYGPVGTESDGGISRELPTYQLWLDDILAILLFVASLWFGWRLTSRLFRRDNAGEDADSGKNQELRLTQPSPPAA